MLKCLVEWHTLPRPLIPYGNPAVLHREHPCVLAYRGEHVSISLEEGSTVYYRPVRLVIVQVGKPFHVVTEQLLDHLGGKVAPGGEVHSLSL